MKRIALELFLVIFSACAFAAPALATTNLFTPVSGSAFQGEGSHGPGHTLLNNLVTSAGGIYWADYSNSIIVEASLGHANGGSNDFNFIVFANNNNVTCWVLSNADLNASGAGNYTQWSSGQSVGGLAQTVSPITVSTSFAASYLGQTYTAYCYLPPVNGNSAGIIGVVPNH
jgi:hypothetical protein